MSRKLELVTWIAWVGLVGCGDRGTSTPDAASPVTQDDAAMAMVESDAATPEDAAAPIDAATPFVDIDAPMGCTSTSGDQDGDGFDVSVDCNDCSPQINPGAFDYAANDIDEDCDGRDGMVVQCDYTLDVASTSADDAARALGLCQFTDVDSGRWGVLSARYVRASGTGAIGSPLQHGVLRTFGNVAPLAGGSLLALSSGVARAPSQPGYTTDCDEFSEGAHDFPPGYQPSSPACPEVESGEPYDSIALEVEVRVPTNARSFEFRSSFYTYEYPSFICSEYNDFFVVLRGNNGAFTNIVFDTMNNPISVNSGFLAVCSPGTYGGRDFTCPQGRGLLSGTGFDGSASCGGFGGDSGGSTGWLRTVAPVSPGSIITLRFAIWDSGDAQYDSTALIDGWEWALDEVTMTMTEPEIPD